MDAIGHHREGDINRRTFITAVGTLTGVGSVTGCVGRATDTVTVLSAGSLARTFEDYIVPAFKDDTGITIYGEYYGTNTIMRLVEDRTKHPDVIVSADAVLLRDRLYEEVTNWDVEFAANSIGIGYNDKTPFGRQLDNGEPWYKLAQEIEEGDLAISDPDLDPLGYRAVQAFELAEHEHDLNEFQDTLLQLIYKEPEEPQLLAGVESGDRAAAIIYRNMAVDHEVPFFEFPDKYNFASPEMTDHYATVEYTTDTEGYTAEGRPILYNVTVNEQADAPDAGHQLVQFLIDNPDLLIDAGLTVGDQLPRLCGGVPKAINI